jgi:eukaryotic-like serine/threonine-protein kinase
MNKIFRFVFSRLFILNLALIVVFVVVLFFTVYSWLGSYTNHGETVTVPDLKGQTLLQVEEFLSNKNLRFAIMDSSVFDSSKPKGTVIEQEPAPNSKVKENRTIYLTITRTIPPQIKLPGIIDVPYKQALAMLGAYDIQVKNMIYKPDLAQDAVLAILFRGKEIKPGEMIAKGSSVDLVLGDGFGITRVSIPNLYSLTIEEARFVIKGSALNLGLTVFDESVRDSSAAKIYRQNPSWSPSDSISQGEPIDIYLTQSEEKLKIFNPNDR